MQADKQFAISGNWALASDGLQWVLQRRGGSRWHAIAFVRSTKSVLSRCMRENGCASADADRLLSGLPARFDEWAASRLEGCHDEVSATPPIARPSAERLTDGLSRAPLGAFQ